MLNVELTLGGFDARVGFDTLRGYLIGALEEAEDRLIAIMADEIMQAPAGATDWKIEMAQALKEVYRHEIDTWLEAGVGLDLEDDSYKKVRALLVTYGGGSQGPTGIPIHAGPYGRTVWDEDLRTQKPSEAKTEYDLPAAFNQPGYNWINNAIKRLSTEIEDILRAAFASMPIDILQAAIRIT